MNLSIAGSGMSAAEKLVDVLSNNIANVNTIGFKEHRVEFQDLMYDNLTRVGITSAEGGSIIPTGVQVGLGVHVGATYRINTQGDISETGNDTDMAIRGRGFFRVEKPDGGFVYTRAGAFQVSPDGQIITSKGFLVSPGITIPQDAVSVDINDAGQVYVMLPGETAPALLGQFNLYKFINEKGLLNIGDNLLEETEASGAPVEGTPNSDGFGNVKQKWLEYSNVNLIKQMTDLIKAQRCYEQCSTFIQAGSEMLKTANQIRT